MAELLKSLQLKTNIMYVHQIVRYERHEVVTLCIVDILFFLFFLANKFLQWP